jgi:hypothetical protein
MRSAAPASIAIAIFLTMPAISRAEFRHLSSRLLAGPNNDGITGFGGTGTARYLAVGDAGDIFLIVDTDGQVSFGGAPVGPGTVAARIRSDGTEVWSRVLVVSGVAGIVGIAAAPDGGAVIAGQLFNSVDFGGGVLIPSGVDAFVVKLDGTGAVAWQRKFGDSSAQVVNDMRVAANGDIVIIGSNRGVIDFGGGGIRSNGSDDVFLARLDGNSGGHIWSRGYGQTGSQYGSRLAIGGGDRIAIECQLGSGSMDLGGGPLTRLGVAIGVLDANAGHLWSRVIGGHATIDVALDDSDNLFLCGGFNRSLDIGDEMLVAEPTATFTGFVASYGPAGAYRWSYMVADSLESIARWLGTDHAGNCFLLATKSGALEVPGLSLPPSGFFLLAFDSFGAITGTSGFGGTDAHVNALMVAASDEIHLAGHTDSEIDFGGGALFPDLFDVFLATLAVQRPALVAIDGFTARYDEDHVELKWNLTSGEPVRNQFLTRTDVEGSGAQVIYSRAAVDGTTSVVDGQVQPGHTYIYEITVETALGDAVSDDASIIIPVFATSIAQNTPNPFNPLTTFPYTLAAPAHVSIAIYDLSGAIVVRLDQGMQPAGKHRAQWAGHNWEGNLVGSGVYFYRLEGAGDVGARKMVLLK